MKNNSYVARDFFSMINKKLGYIGTNNWNQHCGYDLTDVEYKENGGNWTQYKDLKEENLFYMIVKNKEYKTIAVVTYKRIFNKSEKIILIEENYRLENINGTI